MANIMANGIAKALGQSSQTTSGRQGFRPGTGAGYQAARVKPETVETGLGTALQDFVKNGANAFMSYEANQQSTADERSNEIIRKLSPEQRRQAIGDGTLLYKDDAEAMQQLRLKSGRNAAYEVDNEIQQEVQQGKYRTRGELDEARQTRMDQKSKNYAEMAGIDPSDSEYQRGFNSDITKRNAAVYDLHSQYLSKNLETQAVLETRADLQPMLDDPKVLGNPASSDHFASYMNNGLKSGIFPSDAHAVKAVQLLVSEAVNKEGGVQFLDSFGDKTINVYGGQRKVRDLIEPTIYEGLKVDAQNAAYTRNSKRTENVTLGIANAIHQANPADGWQALNKLEQENDWIQTGEQMTPTRQALISAKAQLIGRVAEQSKQGAIKLQQAGQSDNRQAVLSDAWDRKLNGELVSVDPHLLPTNEMTGKFTAEDEANYASSKMNQIMSMDLPDDQKTNLTLQYVKADRKDGPFRKIMGEFVDQASAEWGGAVISGATQRDYPLLNRLRELSKADPVSIAMLYPEKADLVAKLNAMDRYGIDMATAVEAEKAQSKLTREERNQQGREFTTMIRKSKSAAQYMPAEMNEMARTVYEANVALTGNLTAAQGAVEAFVETNTTQFKTSGKPMGAVFKTEILMDPNDVTSWKAGQVAVQSRLDGFSQAHPEVTTGGAFVVSRNGQLYIQTLNGRVEPLHMQDIRDENQKAVLKTLEAAKHKEQADIKRSQEGFTGYAEKSPKQTQQ